MRPADERANQESFVEKGYAIVRNAVSEETLELVTTYCRLQRERSGHFVQDRPSEPTSIGRYADMVTESLLVNLQPLMERNVGARLMPTCSYLRIYENGADLHKHTDRPACEVSATLTLSYRSDALWPIWIERRQESLPVALDRGDLLIYMGAQVPHWRERFDGEYWIQVFLHYVLADGELTEFQLDRRKHFGEPAGYAGRTWKQAVFATLWPLLRPLFVARFKLKQALSGTKAEPSRPPEPIAMDPSEYDKLAGTYKSGHKAVLNIVSRDRRLFLHGFVGDAIATGTVELFPESSRVFFSKPGLLRVSFVDDDRGQTTEMVMLQKGRETVARKIQYPSLLGGA